MEIEELTLGTIHKKIIPCLCIHTVVLKYNIFGCTANNKKKIIIYKNQELKNPKSSLKILIQKIQGKDHVQDLDRDLIGETTILDSTSSQFNMILRYL